MKQIFFFFLILILSPSVYSHEFKVNRAWLTIEQESIQLVLDLDFVEIVQQLHNQQGSAEDLVAAARALSLSEIAAIREKIIAIINGQSYLLIDEQRIKFSAARMPSAALIRHLLDKPPQGVDYRVNFKVIMPITVQAEKVSLSLSPLVGEVNLVINQPNRQLVKQGSESVAFYIKNHTNDVEKWLAVVIQGVLHIIPKGLDHILFVLLLYLGTSRYVTLIGKVSLFTLAHSITLSLAGLGLISLSSNIVEPLIATSIILLAIQNLRHQHSNKHQSFLLIFVFGLLHGLGFASVFSELGYQGEALILQLLAFNLGIELAQLFIIAIAIAAFWCCRQKIIYQSFMIPTANKVIGGVGGVLLLKLISG